MAPGGLQGYWIWAPEGLSLKAEGGGQKDTEMENLEQDHGSEWLKSGGRQMVTEGVELKN